MKKLLYITDQQEYAENGAIIAVFHHYLKKYLDVNVVYFTKFKHSFQKKGDDFVVPLQYRKDLFSYLERQGIAMGEYDYILVRNMYDLLRQVLRHRSKYGYKVGFRVSIPQTTQVYEVEKLRQKNPLYAKMRHRLHNYLRRRLINQCDIFLPNSKTMREIFYPHVTTEVYPLRPGLDPARVEPYLHTTGEDVTFIYAGTIDAINRFEVILEAFAKLEATNWQLHISTRNPDFIRALLEKFPQIAPKVTLQSALSLEELMEQIRVCDIGIALFPQIPIHESTIPAKVMEYYTCCMPALINDNAKNRTLFKDGENAFLTDFDVEKISEKLAQLISTPPEKLAKVGEAGQKRILGMARNYETMSKNLYERLEALES